jgi:hypothetical protein
LTRPWLLLALLVAFSGTPLRLAEAADDLARSLAGPEDEGEFEAVDGGIGDDSGETVRADVAHGSVDSPFDGIPAAFACTAPASLRPLPSAGRPPFRPPAGPTRRHVLLERFLC